MNITISRIWVINVTHSLHLSPISRQRGAGEHSPAKEHNRYITVAESRAEHQKTCRRTAKLKVTKPNSSTQMQLIPGRMHLYSQGTETRAAGVNLRNAFNIASPFHIDQRTVLLFLRRQRLRHTDRVTKVPDHADGKLLPRMRTMRSPSSFSNRAAATSTRCRRSPRPPGQSDGSPSANTGNNQWGNMAGRERAISLLGVACLPTLRANTCLSHATPLIDGNRWL